MNIIFKALIVLSILFVPFFAPNTQAATKNDLCICQTGSAPKVEIPFFKLGCHAWNAGQSCKEKIITSQDDSIENTLKKYPNVKAVKLGYVGHWASSDEVVDFLKEQIAPVVKQRQVSFDIDNTACRSTNRPYAILSYLKSLGSAGSLIHFRGNQVISTGMWDQGLPGKNNFWATINGSSLRVSYPSCKEFENKGCMGKYQARSEGICEISENEFKMLRCESVTRKVRVPGPNDRGFRKVNKTSFLWVAQDDVINEEQLIATQRNDLWDREGDDLLTPEELKRERIKRILEAYNMAPLPEDNSPDCQDRKESN